MMQQARTQPARSPSRVSNPDIVSSSLPIFPCVFCASEVRPFGLRDVVVKQIPIVLRARFLLKRTLRAPVPARGLPWLIVGVGILDRHGDFQVLGVSGQ